MIDEKERLLSEYLRSHRHRLNKQIMWVAVIFLTCSMIWNTLFQWFHLPFSRAHMPVLFGCALLWLVLYAIVRTRFFSSNVLKHVVLNMVVLTIIGLYFGSGYIDSWGYFLIIPLVAGLYCDRTLLMFYSGEGMLLLALLSLLPSRQAPSFDMIDLANRLLLFVIIGTFSYLILKQFQHLYSKHVNQVVESAEKTIEQVVNSFVIAIEAKDSYTFGHSERVSRYATELAKYVPEFQRKTELTRLRFSSLLHDIGKINIPEAILTKPAKLTEEEYEIVKSHPVAGAKMVEKIEGLETLKSGVLYHHERWDGNGYPAGLREDEIPLEARILAVADAFDAMTSSRAYREAMSVSEAFKRLLAGRGTQFDPDLIDLLDSVKMQWLKIYRQAHDSVDEMRKMTDLM